MEDGPNSRSPEELWSSTRPIINDLDDGNITREYELNQFEDFFNNSAWLRDQLLEPVIGHPKCPLKADKYGIGGASCYAVFVENNEDGTYGRRTCNRQRIAFDSLKGAINHHTRLTFYFTAPDNSMPKPIWQTTSSTAPKGILSAKPTRHPAYTPYNPRLVSINIIVFSRYFSLCYTYPYHMRPLKLSVLMLESSRLLRVQPSTVHACVYVFRLGMWQVNRTNVVCLLFDLFKFEGLSGQVPF